MATTGDTISWYAAAGGTWQSSGSVVYKVSYVPSAPNDTVIHIRPDVDSSPDDTYKLIYTKATSIWSDSSTTAVPHQLTNTSSFVTGQTSCQVTSSQYLYLWNGSTNLLGALQIPSWGQATAGGGSGSGGGGSTSSTVKKVSSNFW